MNNIGFETTENIPNKDGKPNQFKDNPTLTLKFLNLYEKWNTLLSHSSRITQFLDASFWVTGNLQLQHLECHMYVSDHSTNASPQDSSFQASDMVHGDHLNSNWRRKQCYTSKNSLQKVMT